MAVHGASPVSNFRYVLSRDPAKDKDGNPLAGATVFHLRTLDGYEKARLRDLQVASLQAAQVVLEVVQRGGSEKDAVDAVSKQTVDNLKLYETAYTVCRMGLVKWENFTTEDGTPIPFETLSESVGGRDRQYLTTEAAGRISPEDAVELMMAITKGVTVSDDEEKKSGARRLPVKSSQRGSARAAQPRRKKTGDATQGVPSTNSETSAGPTVL